jgi:hypothetical protein
MRLLIALIVAMTWLPTRTADAQHVSLDIRDGIVTLDARDVSLQAILAEWSRIGGTRVVALRDQTVASAPVTVLLRDITERQALDFLLRDLSGYLLVARSAEVPGQSAFGEIILVPSSNAPSGRGGGPTVAPAAFAGRAIDLATSDGIGAAPLQASGEVGEPGSVEHQPLSDGVVDLAASGGEAAGDQASLQSVPPAPGSRPPSPMLPPSQGPDANNPFGKVGGSARPGVVMTGNPPPGVWYPPVTNPDLNVFRPGQSAPR